MGYHSVRMAITRRDFDRIEAEARSQWDKLDADPVLAAPWHQLFRQVAQTPRHVLSELLQNADDAGATFASARIEDGAFVFEHDGADFEPDHLRSLCRFGYSNKRSLWTIGFRGIGFKATFSLGPTVEVRTPSASFAFDARRFTQPKWLGGGSGENVVVRVPLVDQVRIGDAVRNSLREWTAFPVALLFFRNVKRLVLDGAEITARFLRRGPAASDEIELSTPNGQTVHARFRARAERLPSMAVAEVRQERMTEDVAVLEAGIDLVTCEPGCGRLFAVLPTDVQLPLGVCINAPFVQDPARTAIKSPAVSPTNRWLLERAGALAVKTMTRWLGAQRRRAEGRARAYELLPDKPPTSAPSTTSDQALAIYGSAFEALGDGPSVLLGSRGDIDSRERVLVVPNVLHAVWPPDALRSVFGAAQHVDVLHEAVPATTRDRLARWRWSARKSRDECVARLAEVQPPRPATHAQLAELWQFVAARSAQQPRWGAAFRVQDLAIVPVIGSTALHRSVDVARLRVPTNERDESAREFLATRVPVLDERFVEHISKNHSDPVVNGLLQKLGLDRPTDEAKVFTIAVDQVFASRPFAFQDALALFQILAASDARIPPKMPLLRRDGGWRTVGAAPILLGDECDDTLLPSEYVARHAIDARYVEGTKLFSAERVRAWLRSPRGDASMFPRPLPREKSILGRSALERALAERGGATPTEYGYKSATFAWGDYDFADELITTWTRTAALDATVWPRVLRESLRCNVEALSRSTTVSVHQIGSTGNRKALQVGRPRAAWLDRLQDLHSVFDADGVPQLPSDLVILTRDTHALQHVEKFVHSSLDDRRYHSVLRELGVRDRARGVADVLRRLRMIARLENAPVDEVVRLYRLLDGVSATQAAGEELRAAFDAEALILGDDGLWYTRGLVTRYGDEDMPEIARVVHDARDLGLWTRVGVSDRPSAVSIVDHIRAYRVGHGFPPEQAARVARLFDRVGPAVLEGLGRWISVTGHMVAVSALQFQVAPEERSVTEALASSIREKTALVSLQHRRLLERRGLRPLASAITWAIAKSCIPSDHPLPGWLQITARHLSRVVVPEQDEAQNATRAAAARLARARWGEAGELVAVPLVDGVAAGPSQPRLVVWTGAQIVCEAGTTEVQLFEALIHVLAGLVGAPWTDLLGRVAFRSGRFVREYLQHHVPRDADAPVPREPAIDAPPEPMAATVLGGIADTSGATQPATVSSEPSLVQHPTQQAVTDEPEPSPAPSVDESCDAHDADEERSARPPDVSSKPSSIAADEVRETVKGGHDASGAPKLGGSGDESAGPSAQIRQSPAKPVIEQWLLTEGFRWMPAHQHWRAPDGRIALRTPGDSAFNWEIRRENAVDAEYIWSSDSGDLGDGIDMPGAIGDLLQRISTASIVVRDADGRPIRLTGAELRVGTITWSIVRYRLRAVR